MKDNVTTAHPDAGQGIESQERKEAVALLRTLQELQSRMSTLFANLPEEEEGPEGPEPGQLLRSTLACILIDRINPAVEDLSRALTTFH